jgi:AraC-like DNA-binding protein
MIENHLPPRVERRNEPSLLSFFYNPEKRNKSSIVQLNNDELERLKQTLTVLMSEKKPFLIKGYHLKDMSFDLQLPIHQLSAFINQVFRMHFSDFMNKHRINYCLELINADLKKRPDLNQLAQKCGFNNRSSFTAAFKRFTGQPPFEFVKRKLFLQLMVSMQTVNDGKSYNF